MNKYGFGKLLNPKLFFSTNAKHKVAFKSGVYKTTEIHFFIPPPTFEYHFFNPGYDI